MGKIKSIVDYMYDNIEETKMSGVMNLLSEITPEKKKRKIVKLHNIVKTCWYECASTAFELMITFDSKKWNVNAIEEIHRHVESFIYRKSSNFNTIVMREFGDGGLGRVHYHGLIKQIRGGQTEMAKVQAYIKNTYGFMSYIRHIREPMRYIAYMLKRTVQEENLLLREIKTTMMVKDMVRDDDYVDTEYYTWEMLKDYQKGHKKDD